MSDEKNAPSPDTKQGGVIGYMCAIDFECELGCASGGNKVYASAAEALCAGTCGVVEVEVIGRRTLIEMNIEDESEDDEAKEQAKAWLEAFDRGEHDGTGFSWDT